MGILTIRVGWMWVHDKRGGRNGIGFRAELGLLEKLYDVVVLILSESKWWCSWTLLRRVRGDVKYNSGLRIITSTLRFPFPFESWWEAMLDKTSFNNMICSATVSAYTIMASSTIKALCLPFRITRFSIVIMNLECNNIFIVDNN